MRAFVFSVAALAGLWMPVRAADDVNPEEIIRKFAAKELEFQQARNNYTYRQSVKMEDVQDLRNVQPFVLTTPEIPEYDIQYLGKEKVDDISCYTFSVKPKKMVQGKRYFEGQIWVDDRDLQIVKTYGKGV